MQTLEAVTGCLVLILISLAFCGGAFAAAVSAVGHYRDKRDDAVRDLAKRAVGSRLLNAAYWFTGKGNESAFHVLKIIGGQLAKEGYFDESAARDELGKALLEEARPPAA